MLNLTLTIALTLLTLMVTVSGNSNPTNHTNPTNPTTKYHCEFVNLNCISARLPCRKTLGASTDMSRHGYPAEVGALFTTVSSIRVSRVGRISRVSSVRVTLTVTVRVSRVSVMVSVRDSVK